MKYLFILQFLVICFVSTYGQNYTSYFTGNSSDIVTNPLGGVCLMGGATEDDNAMKWFLQRADGGDVLVLRTSGSDGYNNYLYASLGITVNSVETIVCQNAAASYDTYLHQKIQQAEAIWFAGGDQWNYVSYWRNTPIDSLINEAITQRNIVIGGTSAGMAIQGKYYFSAQNGTVTSSTALSNPYNNNVTVSADSFLYNEQLSDVITDTHFDNPNRKGRLVTFLARIYTDFGVSAKAIACDEYTAICIGTDGIAKVFGGHPTYDDNAYFLQVNCELMNQTPENCTVNNPLTWNLGGEAIKVYNIKGTTMGTNTFDLNDWETGVGGTWHNWSVNNGTLLELSGNVIDCSALSVQKKERNNDLKIYPNPAENKLTVASNQINFKNAKYEIYNAIGQQVFNRIVHKTTTEMTVNINFLHQGIYYLRITMAEKVLISQKFVKQQ